MLHLAKRSFLISRLANIWQRFIAAWQNGTGYAFPRWPWKSHLMDRVGYNILWDTVPRTHTYMLVLAIGNKRRHSGVLTVKGFLKPEYTLRGSYIDRDPFWYIMSCITVWLFGEECRSVVDSLYNIYSLSSQLIHNNAPWFICYL